MYAFINQIHFKFKANFIYIHEYLLIQTNIESQILVSIDPTSLSPNQSKYSMIPIVTSIAAKLPPVKYILSKLISIKHGSGAGSGSSINTSTIAHKNISTTSIPLLLLLLLGCARIVHYNIHIGVTLSYSILLVIASLYIHHAYYTHRAHANGNLTVLKEYSGTVIISTIAIIYTTSQLILNDDGRGHGVNGDDDGDDGNINRTFGNVMIFLMGALVASTASASFASVADVWYAVGTGQFQMISVDTAGIGFYFVLPLGILSMRFVEKYHLWLVKCMETVSNFMTEHSDVYVKAYFDLEDDVSWVYVCWIVLVLMNVVMGVSMVNSLCPLSGYLFGRTYMHGQPHTGRIAICVEYSDLKAVMKEQREELFQEMLKKNKKGGANKNVNVMAVLNINVTASDLAEHEQDIQLLRKDGHEIVITIDGASVNSINVAYQSFATAFDGASATWYHTGTNLKGTVPQSHSIASSLGMRSVMWSNYITSMNNAESLEEGLVKHGGGSIVYVCGSANAKASASKSGDFVAILKRVLELVEGAEFVPTTLSLVVKEDNTMEL